MFVAAVQKHLKWEEEDAYFYLGESRNDELDACRRLLKKPFVKWEETKKKYYFEHLERLLLLQSVGCSHQNLIGTSLFELEIITRISPFYAYTALKVPFDQCIMIAKGLQNVQPKPLVISENILAYNLVYHQLQTSTVVSFEKFDELCRESGIDPQKVGDVSRVHPFGRYILDDHPLRDHDPRYTPEAKLMEYVKFGGNIVTSVRERNNLVNKITKNQNGYKMIDSTDEFIETLINMIGEVVNN